MGFYEKLVVPRLINMAMRNTRLASYRQETIGAARGLVLEIGVGSGLSLPIYSPAVDRVCGIDPSPELLRLASQRLGDASVPVSLVRASAEQLPFSEAVFDTLVMTWTLCSIPNPNAALHEMRRVLKAVGRLLFVEHGLSREARIMRWQHWLTPCWKRIGGGCHLDRKMDDLIRAAGFGIDTIETGYMAGPRALTFNIEVRRRSRDHGRIGVGFGLHGCWWACVGTGSPISTPSKVARPGGRLSSPVSMDCALG